MKAVIIGGARDTELVPYPIHNDAERPGRTLMNWAMGAKIGDGSERPPHTVR